MDYSAYGTLNNASGYTMIVLLLTMVGVIIFAGTLPFYADIEEAMRLTLKLSAAMFAATVIYRTANPADGITKFCLAIGIVLAGVSLLCSYVDYERKNPANTNQLDW